MAKHLLTGTHVRNAKPRVKSYRLKDGVACSCSCHRPLSELGNIVACSPAKRRPRPSLVERVFKRDSLRAGKASARMEFRVPSSYGDGTTHSYEFQPDRRLVTLDRNRAVASRRG